jgi:hypothetical protein
MGDRTRDSSSTFTLPQGHPACDSFSAFLFRRGIRHAIAHAIAPLPYSSTGAFLTSIPLCKLQYRPDNLFGTDAASSPTRGMETLQNFGNIPTPPINEVSAALPLIRNPKAQTAGMTNQDKPVIGE